MATVIFDFDSTLIACESLEEVFKAKNIDSGLLKKIQKITAKGMSGEISFLESLQRRLSMSPVTNADFQNFGEQAGRYLTPGIKDLVQELMQQGVDVWIVSGALKGILLPVGKALGIPESHMLGIELQWDAQGNYNGIDITKPINRSKWEGARDVSSEWTPPRIAVGDGMTDYALFEHGQVDHFIAFTQNVRRQALLDKRVPEAKTVAELRLKLKEHIDGNTFLPKR